MRRKGFTMIEMLLVVIVLTILASIALPEHAKAVEKSKASEVYLVFEQFRILYKAKKIQGFPPGWNPNIGAAYSKEWTTLGMDDPNANPKGYFTYDFWAADFSVAYPPVSSPRNVLIATRRKTRAAYSLDVNSSRYLYIDVDSGEVFTSPEYV